MLSWLLDKTDSSALSVGIHLGKRQLGLVALAGERHAQVVDHRCVDIGGRSLDAAFGELIEGFKLKRARHIVCSLDSSLYQLLLVDSPTVPDNEVAQAVRWRIGDLLDYPVEEAVVDVFDMPRQARAQNADLVYAVAVKRDLVDEFAQLFKRRRLRLEAIDIPELTLKTIAARMPDHARGVAWLHLGTEDAVLIVVRDGILYLARQIEGGLNEIASADPDMRQGFASRFALEAQRSLDYYESHYDQAPVACLIVSAGSYTGELTESLNAEIGAAVRQFDWEDAGLSGLEHTVSLVPAAGAALHREAVVL